MHAFFKDAIREVVTALEDSLEESAATSGIFCDWLPWKFYTLLINFGTKHREAIKMIAFQKCQLFKKKKTTTTIYNCKNYPGYISSELLNIQRPSGSIRTKRNLRTSHFLSNHVDEPKSRTLSPGSLWRGGVH